MENVDEEELRAGFVARERFAPDPDAVLATVLAHRPPGRSKRPLRRFAAIGIAAAVVLIAGTVGVVRSTANNVTSPPPTAIPTPAESALASTLERNFWTVATVTAGKPAKPLSTMPGDFLFMVFDPDGTVSVNSPSCGSQTVPWRATEETVTIGTLVAEVNKCSPFPGERPSAAAAPLAAAFRAMTAANTVGHLDGRSLVLKAGDSVLVFKSGGASAAASSLPSPSVEAAAHRWAGFPVDARPRPIVLAGSDVVLPEQALPDGNQENALAAGRILPPETAPAAPATMGGYPIITAATAVAQFTDLEPIMADWPVLHITEMQLVNHSFRTDRGIVSLPTWKATLAETSQPIYVLAVAAAGRYPHSLSDDLSFGVDATLSADGRDLTISFVAHHKSEGGCDRDRTATVASQQTSTAVVLAVTTQVHPTVPRPGCTDIYTSQTLGYLTPGRPDTYTLHLQEPLGNRVVVDQLGLPYVVEKH